MTKCTTPSASFPRCKGRQVIASFDGGEVTSDGGILLLRQLDREMGLTRAIARRLSDDRDPQRCLHRTETLVRQRVLGLEETREGTLLLRFMPSKPTDC
ncbi:hypothetical protein D1793_18990 [Halomonas sp. JS92-SW72]|nr:hypothetical protein D1793_18990 [Halomonas sp. JS92-SW72]